MNYFEKYFLKISDCIRSVEKNIKAMDDAVKLLELVHARGGKVLIAGNGGSAAIASHVSVDMLKIAGIRAMNFNEADLITCYANDYGYEHWIEKALESFADVGDLVILISSSGKSQNIINAAKKAKSDGISLMTFSGFSSANPLRNIGDLNFWVESQEYNIIEMTHHIWLLAIVDKYAESKTGQHS